MTIRVALTDFALKNTYYAGASLAVYEVNANLQQTATLATLYADPTGGTLRPNPMVLDSEGKFPTVLYVAKPVILVVTPALGTPLALGVQGLISRWRGVWTTGTLYYPGERVRDPAGPTTYVVLAGHTSATFATDVSNGLLQQEIDGASISAAAAASLFGTTLPSTPAEGYYRINAGGTGVEARTPAQVRADIAAFAAAGGNISGNVDLIGTGYLRVPTGLTGQRPGTPLAGMLRYNSELAALEAYAAAAWDELRGRTYIDRAAGQKVLVTSPTPTSIPNATITTLSWGTEVFDEPGAWAAGTPGRLTAPAWATKVLIGANLQWGAGSTQSRVLIIQKNAAGSLVRNDQFATGVAGTTLVTMDSCVGGDFYQLQAFQDTGGAFSLNGGGVSRFWATFFA